MQHIHTNRIPMKSQQSVTFKTDIVSKPWYSQRWPWLLMLGRQ
ncbi:hypothetical protein CAter10_2455 [Collimonas arenae]|nr:hypothetical protein CAter10_2455 [Collimonas arenae]